jgi:tetratricopeptide (TPR) repeat protein
MTPGSETSGAVGFLAAPALFRDLLLRKATGQLVAYRGETIKKVFFKSGFVLYATSNLPGDRLGDVLLARGTITRDQYEESVSQVLATGRKQGTVLVQIGALQPKDLFRGLIAQVREIATSIFRWDDGSWRFLDGAPPQDEIVNLRLHTAGLIFEGLAGVAADRRFAQTWDPPRMRFEPAADAPFVIEELDLPDPARRLYALVEQGRPVAEMPRLVGADQTQTAAMLYGLSLLRMIETRPTPKVKPPPAPAPAAPAAPRPDDAELRRLREKVTALAARLDKLSHYQLLGLTPESDPDAIKRAYIALAKDYHPDRFFRPEFEDLQEQVNTIFMRINEVYSTLHNPATREQYDRNVLRVKAPVGRVQEAAPDSKLAHVQFSKGVALLNAGDLWSAIQALRWAVSLSPQNPRYHTWLGVALTRTKKRLHEAEEHCKTAIALDYNNADYYVNLGQVYRTGHLAEKARKQFETALRLDPRHAGALREIRELEAAADQLRKK